MDQRDLELKQPSGVRYICIRDLTPACGCPVCQSQRDYKAAKAAQVGDPLALITDQEAGQ